MPRFLYPTTWQIHPDFRLREAYCPARIAERRSFFDGPLAPEVLPRGGATVLTTRLKQLRRPERNTRLAWGASLGEESGNCIQQMLRYLQFGDLRQRFCPAARPYERNHICIHLK